MRRTLWALAIAAVACGPLRAEAAALGPDFAADYTITDLGAVSGLPIYYGGLVFRSGDPGTILIGGDANTAAGGLYALKVTRDSGGHITGVGTATLLTAAPYNDGGFAYGPGGVLFLSQWPVNGIMQFKPGPFGPGPDKVQDVTALGVASSQAALQFVPFGFGGSGRMKGLSWSGGEFYTFTIAPDGSGTYDVTGAVQETTLGGGPEGFVYISNANPGFAVNSMLVSEFSAGSVAAYGLDGSGNPVPGTRRDFITGLVGAEGAAIDPLTGDFLFSTFSDTPDLIVVRGFKPPVLPEPASAALLLAGLAGMAALRRRR